MDEDVNIYILYVFLLNLNASYPLMCVIEMFSDANEWSSEIFLM